jgi:hypothetical protein
MRSASAIAATAGPDHGADTLQQSRTNRSKAVRPFLFGANATGRRNLVAGSVQY